jgi:hypothetical protein
MDDVEKVRQYGRAWLNVETYSLTPPGEGERAAFISVQFSVCLSWPQ